MNTFNYNEYIVKYNEYVNDIYKEQLNKSIEEFIESYYYDCMTKSVIKIYELHYCIEKVIKYDEFAVCFQCKRNNSNSKRLITFHVSVGNRDCRFMYYHNGIKKWIIDEDLIDKKTAETIIKFLTQKTDFKNKLEEKLQSKEKIKRIKI